MIAAILERDPAPLRESPLERIVRRSLAKDPDQRFQTARDLKAAMNWALERPPVPIGAKPNQRWWIVAIAAGVVIGALGSGWAISHFRSSSAEDRVLRVQVEPPEGVKFVIATNVGGIALSPDGRYAAFVGSGNGKSGLWVRSLDDMTARLIPGTERATFPFWSPDSKSIAFFEGFAGQASGLERVDFAGGTPSKICDTGQSRGGAWSGNGDIVFGTVTSGLFRVSAAGGTPTPLTTIDPSHGELSHRWPEVLPKGRFLYWAQANQPENSDVYVASLSSPTERRRVLTTGTNTVYAHGGNGKDYLLWLRGSALMAQEFDTESLKLAGEPHLVADPVSQIGNANRMSVAASASGLLLYAPSNALSQFEWFERTGKMLGVVGEPDEYGNFRISPDDRRVAASRNKPGGADLWLLDAGRGVASRFTSSPGVNQFPVWSPDGRSIVFSEGLQRNLARQVITATGGEQSLTGARLLGFPTDYSRDGRFMLFYEISRESRRQLWILPMDKAHAEPIPYLQSRFDESVGRFSPEASPRWIAYASDESARSEVYINAFPEPGRRTRISTNGGNYPEWGAPLGKDRRELFYVSQDNKLMSVSVRLGADSVEPSTPRELFPLPGVDNGSVPYDVTADGQRFLVRADQASQPLRLIVNWPALLKKGTTTQ